MAPGARLRPARRLGAPGRGADRHRLRSASATSQAVRARLALARHPDVPEPGDDLRYSPLGAALLDLPLGQRHVVVLHYLADLPVEVIARECGLPAGTVKTRLAAGRRRLEALLSQQPEEIGK
ncbi:MAG TPA: sigma factor-like helix-turn-helix DNA-binding protein [Streptosporangiaceae bacterium]|nr:sigma factor-like helix-turn-helix DNA-binding protein [Streptosporangiaceae bacterium]